MGFDTIDLVITVEAAYGIDIPDDVIGKITTVGDLYEHVFYQLSVDRSWIERRQCRSCDYPLRGLTRPVCPECGTAFIMPDDMNRENVWNDLVDLLSEKFGIIRPEIKPEINFTRDLNMD